MGVVAVFNACVELLRHANARQLKLAYRYLLLLVVGCGEDEKGD